MLFKEKSHLRYALVLAISLLVAGLMVSPIWAEKKSSPWENWDHYKQEKPVRGGYFRIAAGIDVGLLNPNHWPVMDWGLIASIYEKLLSTDGIFREVPWLLESYNYLDARNIILTVRKGVTFTDGSVFNAKTLKYQLDWIQDKGNGAWSRAWLKPLLSTTIVDEYSVKLTFNKSWGSFLGIIASVPGYAISSKVLQADIDIKEAKQLAKKAKKAKKKVKKTEKKAKAAAEKGGEAAEKAAAKAKKAREQAVKLEEQAKAAAAKAEGLKKSDNNPVGTAKFMLEDRNPGNWIKIKRNPDWWYGKTVGHPDMPYMDGVIRTIIPDPSVQLANFRAGKIDVLYIAKADYEKLRNDKQIKIYKPNLNWSVGLRFNHTRKPFNDIRVRKAVSHAIDRKALIQGLEFGIAREASNFFPDDHWAHNPNLKPVSYQPELSKKLLVEAGYPDGLVIKGHLGNDTGSVNMAEAVKAMLKKVGVTWAVETLSPAAVDDRIKNLEYDLAGNTYMYMFEPDLCVTNFYHPSGGWNAGRTNNKPVVELIEKGREETDFAKRQAIYWEIERLLDESYEDIYLWWPVVLVAYSKHIRGYVFEGGAQTHKEIWGETHPFWFKDGKDPRD